MKIDNDTLAIDTKQVSSYQLIIVTLSDIRMIVEPATRA